MISRKLLLLFTIFIYLNVLDMYTTILILELGGKEINFFHLHFNEVGVSSTDIILKLCLTALSVFIVFLVYWRSSQENSKLGIVVAYVIIVGLCWFYSYVIWNNVKVLEFQIQEVQRELGGL